MGASIGLLELKSIPLGLKTADEILKAAQVKLLVAGPACPGKYIIIISGNVGAVKNAMEKGIQIAGTFLICNHTINNVHDTIALSLIGMGQVEEIPNIGVIETMSAITAVIAGDIAVKSANVKLIEIRVARGLGGKGFVLFSGEISAVNSALKAALSALGETGDITSSCLITSPPKELLEKLG